MWNFLAMFHWGNINSSSRWRVRTFHKIFEFCTIIVSNLYFLKLKAFEYWIKYILLSSNLHFRCTAVFCHFQCKTLINLVLEFYFILILKKKQLKKGKEDYETNTMLIKIKLIFLKIPLLWLNLKKTPKNPKPICNNFVQSEVSSAQCRG